MAGRNHLPPPYSSTKLREVPLHRGITLHPQPTDDPRRTLQPHHPASTILEDRITIQQREIEALLQDNQRLATTNLALKEDIYLTEEELTHLAMAVAEIKAERDGQVREVYEKSLKVEAEVRALNAMRAELVRVRGDIQKLTVERQELAEELEGINGELDKKREEAKGVMEIKSEVEVMQQEISKGRAAIEIEKKTHASNLEHGLLMEEHRIALTCEIEKLTAEFANAEKRARAAAAAAPAANPSPGYAGSNAELGYGESPHPNPYGMHQPNGNAGPPSVTGETTNGPYDY